MVEGQPVLLKQCTRRAARERCLKNPEEEQLAEELSRLANSSKTEVIRQALREKKERLALIGADARRQRLLAFLQNRVWPHLPKDASRRWTKEEEERALGFGDHGEPV
jgi:hypothetical protein